MNNPDKYKSVMDNGKKLYSNQGNVCKDIMDLIDYYTQNGDSDSFMDKKITVDYSRCGLWIWGDKLIYWFDNAYYAV